MQISSYVIMNLKKVLFITDEDIYIYLLRTRNKQMLMSFKDWQFQLDGRYCVCFH